MTNPWELKVGDRVRCTYFISSYSDDSLDFPKEIMGTIIQIPPRERILKAISKEESCTAYIDWDQPIYRNGINTYEYYVDSSNIEYENVWALDVRDIILVEAAADTIITDTIIRKINQINRKHQLKQLKLRRVVNCLSFNKGELKSVA